MKKTAYILFASLSLAFSASAQSTSAVYRLRFADHDTLQPITNAVVSLVPRRIILKVSPEYKGGDPNEKFAETIRTDSRGFASLPESLAANLTADHVYVDCHIEAYSRFLLRAFRPPRTTGYFEITIFRRDGVVHHALTLRSDAVNVILLENKHETDPNKLLHGDS